MNPVEIIKQENLLFPVEFPEKNWQRPENWDFTELEQLITKKPKKRRKKNGKNYFNDYNGKTTQ